MPAVLDRKHGCFYPTRREGDRFLYLFDYLEAELGRKFDTFSTFMDYGFDFPTNPNPPANRSLHTDVQKAIETGHDLLIGFQPIARYDDDGTGVYRARYGTFAELLAGVYDAKLTAMYTWLLSFGVQVTTRPFWEANLPDSFWHPAESSSTPANRQPTLNYVPNKTWTTTGGPVCTTRQQYKDAFAYFVNLIRGLPNGNLAKFFYCPGNVDARVQLDKGADGVTMTTMYPGDSVIDYNGYDIYNGLSSKWLTPLETLRGYRQNDLATTTRGPNAPAAQPWAYDLFAALSTKPIWIGEINCVDQGDRLDTLRIAPGNSKAAWYETLFALDTTVLPRLERINWFNSPGTRDTYPFNSSADALSSFQQNFAFGAAPSTTQHGVAADPYDPEFADPVDPAPADVYPWESDILPGKGSNSRLHNKARFLLTQTLRPLGRWLGGRYGTDGSGAAVDITAEMGNAFIPALNFRMPAGVGAVRKYLMGSRSGPEASYRWRMRDDGRQEWGPGDTGDMDLFAYRSAESVYTVRGPGGTDATLDAAVVLSKLVKYTDNAAPPTPGVGTATTYGTASAVYVRNVAGSFPIRPAQHDMVFGNSVTPFDPTPLTVSGGATPPILTSGVAATVRLYNPTARNVQRLALGVWAAATGPTGCYLGLFDAVGNLVCKTGDRSGEWVTTGADSATTTTTPLFQPGFMTVLILFTGTQGPRCWGVVNSAGNGTGSARYGTYGSGLTAIPDSIVIGNIVASNNAIWVSVT